MASRVTFEKILAKFPQDIRLAFAYGSGIFQQKGHEDMSKNMMDFILTVDNPAKWHKENMKLNYNHYSFLKYLGPNQIARVQEDYGASVYFNTLVPCEGRLIKYGVISTSKLITDLLDWETLYVSGRLHKPVLFLQQKQDQDLTFALSTNYQNAVHTALLLLPETFTEEQLYLTITGLSYSGDFRMTVGEDKNKVSNIVAPNMERFRLLYEQILTNEVHLFWNKSQGTFEQSVEPRSCYHHLNLLPKMMQVSLVTQRNMDGRNRDVEEVFHSVAHDWDCPQMVEKCVADIVKYSSSMQSLKGILTAGLIKTVKYSSSKLRKMWKSKQKSEDGKNVT